MSAGNAIAMGVSGSAVFGDPALELFAYAGMMLLVMVIFVAIATRYTYRSASLASNHCNRLSDELQRWSGARRGVNGRRRR